MKPKIRWHDLIARYQVGEITDEEVRELESVLRESPEARGQFRQASRIDTRLRLQTEALEETPKAEAAHNQGKVIAFPGIGRWRISWLDAGLAAAVVLLLASMIGSWVSRPEVIATIVSTEDAAWESSLPTAPGSELTPGHMTLTSGIATLRFRSGAEMVLEAPARLSIETPMLARLDSGAVMMDVPESAIGFVLETPGGRVVDHGTAFAVNVSDQQKRAVVEVIEGEVSVHHDESGEELRLREEEAASIEEERLAAWEGPFPIEEQDVPEDVLRVGTDGRSYSVIRANKAKWLHPDKLMVRRRAEASPHERRSFLSFDLSGVDLERVESVRLRLNQVPSGIGYASRLPKVSDVAVHGLTNPEKVDWKMDSTWEDGPRAADGVLLGHLEIPRSRQRGSRFLESEALLEFLRSRGNDRATFILDGEVDPATGERVPSMVLAFASDTHPEAAGPMLEFTLKASP